MTLVCGIDGCDKELCSELTDKDQALKDLLSLLKTHAKHKHKEDYKSYEEHLAELSVAWAVLPDWLFLQNFLKPDDSRTDDRVNQLVDQTNEVVDLFAELFSNEVESEDAEEPNLATGEALEISRGEEGAKLDPS